MYCLKGQSLALDISVKFALTFFFNKVDQYDTTRSARRAVLLHNLGNNLISFSIRFFTILYPQEYLHQLRVKLGTGTSFDLF